MQSIAIGLFAAFLAAVTLAATQGIAVARTPPVDPEARMQGMAAAPAIISSTGMDCRMVDARHMGGRTVPKSKEKKEDKIDYYEIACKGAEGFVVATHTSVATEVYTCIEAVAVKRAACQLPDNADAKAGIAPELAAAGVSCAIKDARGVGHTDDGKETVFEVSCQDGSGYILHTSFPVSVSKPVRVEPCLAMTLSNAGPPCTLTDAATVNASFNDLVSQSGKNCQVKDRRFVGMAQEDNSFVYEVACQDGKGYLVFQSDKGALVKTVDCATVETCKLTDPRAAEIERAELYSKRARTAGYACDVSKYARFQVDIPAGQAIELQCSNRPDGAVAIFPASETGSSQIYDCAHSELIGFRCQLTEAGAAYPSLTNDLHKLGKTSCVVSSSSVFGKTKDNFGYIEVACADGTPGFLIGYTLPAMTPSEAVACGHAKFIGGGCTLPGNTKRS
jgi:hypothetical protein